jgi:hypothetical protein
MLVFLLAWLRAVGELSSLFRPPGVGKTYITEAGENRLDVF